MKYYKYRFRKNVLLDRISNRKGTSLVIFCLLFISLVTFVITYGAINNSSVTTNGLHTSGVEDNVLYINDVESDWNYYMGLNYTTPSTAGLLPTTTKKDLYNANSLVQLQITYSSIDFIDNTIKGYVSETEAQDTYVYYKVYNVNDNGTPTNKNDDYVEFELIDNPFTYRPNNKGFNGWLTDNINTEIRYDKTYHARWAKIPVTYHTDGTNKINVTFNASWIESKVGYTSDGWSSAFSDLDTFGMHELETREITGYTDNTDYSEAYYQSSIGRNQSCVDCYRYRNGNYTYYPNTYTCTSNTCTVYLKADEIDDYTTYYNFMYINGRYSRYEIYQTLDPVYEMSTQFKDKRMSGYYKLATVNQGSSQEGYYNNDGEYQTGTCNSYGGCTLFEFIDGRDETLADIDEQYYYLATRDTNIIVFNSNMTSTWGSSYTKPFTLTGLYNGNNYRNTYTFTTTNISVHCYADTVIENIRIYCGTNYANSVVVNSGSNNTKYLYGGWFNVRLGRGIISTTTNGTCFTCFIGGAGNSSTGSSSNTTKYRLIVESGKYNSGSLTYGYVSSSYTGYLNAKAIYGNDYDRATNNNNNFIINSCLAGSYGGLIHASSNTDIAIDSIYKSGQIGKGKADNVTGTYIGGRHSGTHYSARRGVIEGGWLYNVIGGPLTDSTQASYNDLYLYVKGGTISAIWAGAGLTATYGNRIVQMTDGLIEYSLFGGSCAYSGNNGDGTVKGSSFVYVGGNAIIGNETYVNNNSKLFGNAEAGSVFGIGNGKSGLSSVGSNDNSNVIIDGNALIRRNVYGGGNFGATGVSSSINTNTTNLFIKGGTIKGSVYGGGNNNGAGSTSKTSIINIEMTGGSIEGSLYGGSNQLGTVYGTVNINVEAGTIGQNVYGGGQGGYKDNTNIGTYVDRDVNVTIGETSNASIPNITGSVYGGSAYGTVNGTTRNTTVSSYTTNVTINKGTMLNVYGGGQGGVDNGTTYTPYVKGPVTVTINDGTISNVFGGNDLNGVPNSTVKVRLYGGTISNEVYGGGNATVVHNTDVLLQGSTINGTLYGGSKQIPSTSTTESTKVIVSKGTVPLIYGGTNTGGATTNSIITVYSASDTNPIDIDNIYGGGKSSDCSRTNVTVGTVSVDNIYGGGYSADVTTSATLALTGTTVTGNVFGGSDTSGVVGTTSITITNGSADYVYGGNNKGTSTASTTLSLTNTNVTHSVYGGGNEAIVSGDTSVTITGGTIDEVYGGGNAATVDDTKVMLKGGNITNLYGGGNSAGVTSSTIEITKATITGSAFGGSNSSGNVGSTSITTPAGTATDIVSVGNVYGGNNLGGETTNARVTLTKGHYTNVYGGGYSALTNNTIVSLSNATVTDYLYGGGNQANVTLGANTTASLCTLGTVFGGGNAGTLGSDATVTLINSTLTGNSYGGGNGETATITGNTTLSMTGSSAAIVFGGGNAGSVTGNTNVTINNTDVTDTIYAGGNGSTATVGGSSTLVMNNGSTADTVYGGGNAALVTTYTDVTIDGSTITTEVFGGGNSATIGTNATLRFTNSITNTLYGGGNLAAVNGNNIVTITGSTVSATIFGGGNGQSASVGGHVTLNVTSSNCNLLYGGGNEAPVTGYVSVTINDTSVTTNIFGGGNGLTASIGGNVILNVNNESSCNLLYGGGNEAPVTLSVSVTIDNIDVNTYVYGGGNGATAIVSGNVGLIFNNSSCDTIYGGGNAARVLGFTNVSLTGSTITNDIFGGGNAASVGTDVTLTVTNTTATTLYGGGSLASVGHNVDVTINGSTFTGIVFGGGNGQSATVGGDVTLDIGTSSCDTLYGGGNEAPVTGFTDVIVDDTDVTDRIYAGGNGSTATVGTNTTLLMENNSTADTVFGGGNSATVAGTVDVTINDCIIADTIYGAGNGSTAIVYDNVTVNLDTVEAITYFGGGNQAHVEGSITTIIDDSTFTGIIYGAGNGETASTYLNIDLTATNTSADTLYGGGNQANVGGTISVTLGTCNIANNIYGAGNGITATTGNTVTLTANNTNAITVYGGGNAALVNGAITVAITGGSYTGTIYGAGNGSSATTTGNINITFIGASADNIYGGGGNARVNGAITVFINNGTITHNIYAGGQGETATVTGNITFNINNTTAVDIYGGGNAASVGGSIDGVVNIATLSGSIYGAGNGETATTSGSVRLDFKNSEASTIFGGGNAASVGGSTDVYVSNSTLTDSIYAGGNGETAIVHQNTTLDVDGTTNVTNSIFGGGNAAETGTEEANNSKGIVNIAGAIVGKNIYGGANTSRLYGEAEVNIGLNAILGINGTDVSVAQSDNTYSNFEGSIELNDTFMNTTGGYWSTFASVTNSLDKNVKDFTLKIHMGSNSLQTCYNCTYEVSGESVIIHPSIYSTDQVTMTSGATYAINGQWNLIDTSEIYVESYYTENVTDPVINNVSSDLIKGDIHVYGTVFGGGEANAEGSESYTYSFISVTTGIEININGTSYSIFDINGSIFGSGNASNTDGYSFINIKNYGTYEHYRRNVSIQRTQVLTVDNSYIELSGATDRTNDYSDTLFTLSRIDELKLKNNSSLYLQTTANLLEKFTSLVDVGGVETKASVSIDSNGNTTRNVDNRLYLYEDKNLNVATDQSLTSYGEVSGMTFFGMYRHDRNGYAITALYDKKYKNNDYAQSGDMYYFTSGSYVLGLHKNNHDINVDGFYSNFDDVDDEGVSSGKIRTKYITPTPEHANYYMWVIGEKIASYEITLTASKYSTLGGVELPLINSPDPNTEFIITGFNSSDLDSNFELTNYENIPRVSLDGRADTRMALVMKTSNTGWITVGDTTFKTDPDSPIEGTTDYKSENSTIVPSLLFYFYHSKNITTSKHIGTVTISLLVVTPIDDLTNHVERLNINVDLSMALYSTNDYEGAMTVGAQYEMFQSTAVNMTSKSTLSAYYSMYSSVEESIYKTGYHRVLVSSFVLPADTKITMIDLTGENPKYYYYVVSQADVTAAQIEYNRLHESSYNLSKFVEMGSTSNTNNYNDAQANIDYYNASEELCEEEFIFIVDFGESNINTTQLQNKLLIELRNIDNQVIIGVLSVQAQNLVYNLYANMDAVIDLSGSLSTHTLYLGDKINLNVTTNFTQQNIDSKIVQDTNYYGKKLGIKISILDNDDNQVNGLSLLGTKFIYGGVTYYTRMDGTIRIKLADRIANLSGRIVIDTANSSLSSGNYKVKVESFGSPDGIYYGLISSDTINLNLNVLNKIYGLKSTLDDKSAILDKITGMTLNDNNDLQFRIEYASGLSNPSIRVKMQRRKYDEVYSKNYEDVDLSDYFTHSYTKVTVYEYLVTSSPSNIMYVNLTSNENIQSGTYKIVFSLYDGNSYIGDVYNYVIIK